MKNKNKSLLKFVSSLSRKQTRKGIISPFLKYVNQLNPSVTVVHLEKNPTVKRGVYKLSTRDYEFGYFVVTGDLSRISENFESEFEDSLVFLKILLENLQHKKGKTSVSEIEEMQEEYSSLFSLFSFEAIFISEKGICVDQNKAAERLFGYTHNEAVGRPGTDWIVPKDREIVTRNMLSDYKYPYQVQALRKDGSTFPCEIQGELVIHNGRKLRITALRDITSRKKAEQLYTAIKESTSDGFALIDMKGRVIEVNETYCNKVEFSHDEMLHKSILEMDPDFNPSGLRKTIKNIIKAGHSRFEARNKTKSGKIVNFDVSVTYINQGEGYFIAFLYDITDRKTQESILRNNENLLHLITSNFPNAYISVVEKNMMVSFSAGQEFQKAKLDPNDFTNISVDEIFGHHASKVKSYYRKTFKGESCRFELHINNQDQLYNTVPIVDDKGIIEKILVVVENVSERKQRERVIQCQVRLSELAHTLSMEELLQAYLDEIEILTDSKIGFFHFVNEDQETLTLQAWSTNTIKSMCSYEGKGLHYPVSEAGVWVDCIHQKKTVVHNDYEALEHKKGIPEGHPSIVREVVVPVIRGKKIYAVLGVGNKEIDYTPQDIQVLKSMADIAWDTVNRKIAEEALRENEEKFRMLFDNINTGVAIYQPVKNGEDFTIVDINKYGEKHSHVKSVEVSGKSVVEVFPGVVEIGLFKVFQKVLKTGVPESLPLIQYQDDRIEEWVENYVFKLPSGLIVALYEDTSEKQKAIEDLSKSEERFRTLAENIPGIVYLCKNDEHYEMLYLNNEIKKLTGYSKNDFLAGKITFAELIHPDDLDNVQVTINKSLRSQKPYNLIYRLKDKKGSFTWVEEFGVGIGKSKDKATHLLEGYIHDISDRINAERSIRESEEKFRTFFSSIYDAVFVHPLKEVGFGKLIEVNDIACIRYGYSREEFLQMSPPDFTLQEEADRHSKESHRGKLMEAGSMVFQTIHVKKSGETFPVEISSNIIELDGKKMILAVARDVSERVKAQEIISESERKFRSVIEQSNDAIYILKNDRFDLINQKFTELTGLTEEDLLKPDFNFINSVAPESVPMIREKRLATQKGERKSDLYEFKLLHKDGRIIDVQASINEIEYKDNKAVLGIMRDITEQKKLELQLLQAQKTESIGHLTGGIAHDFNNLLTPILGNTDLALINVEPSDPLYDSLLEIREMAEHAKDLVSQLLAFSRKQLLDVNVLDLNKLIADFKIILRRTIREDISIETHLTKLKGNIKADKSQLEQVLMNLCVNAQDAMNEGGIITIETDNVDVDDTFLETHTALTKGPHVALSISDTGEGIDEDKMSKIFDPFFTTKEAGKGTGLGLATVHGIIKQHNGNILVYSEIDHGTTFKIYLPLVSDAKTRSPKKETKHKERKGGETILVVEDKDSVRRMAVRILKFHGFNVLEASTPQKAINIAENIDEFQIDLLLTDVIMPGMNGKELYDFIATRQPGIKVVYMSGYTQNVIAHHGVMDEGVYFIQKPFTLETLIDKLNDALEN